MKFDNAFFEKSVGTPEQLVPDLTPEIVFSGRSNVGKSSLINKLLSRKSLARVSSVPGKTVTLNFYRLQDVRLVDLPGYGFAKAPQKEKERWSQMTDGYFSAGRNIKLVIQLVDIRHPPTADDVMMLTYLSELGFPFIIVLTKSDKLNRSERAKRLESLNEELGFLKQKTVIPFSALNGEGTDEIKRQIEQYCFSEGV